MTDDEAIPSIYEAWRECITMKCRIKLTRSFIESRIKEFGQTDHPKTREFRRHYGDDQLAKTIS
jgi:hypothetical protein